MGWNRIISKKHDADKELTTISHDRVTFSCSHAVYTKLKQKLRLHTELILSLERHIS